MIPHLSDSDADSDAADPLAARLRAAARHAAPAPSPALRGRILAAVRATPQLSVESGRVRRRARWLVAAGVLAAFGSAWFLTRAPRPAMRRAVSVAEVTHGLLDTRAQVFALPARAEADLRREAERLLADGSRLAQHVVRGLPATLRTRDERL